MVARVLDIGCFQCVLSVFWQWRGRSSVQDARYSEVETLWNELARWQASHFNHPQSPAEPSMGCRLGASLCALPH